jgi:flagellar protein FlgJ
MLAATGLDNRLGLDVQGAQSWRARARAGDPEALRTAAKQFEALVVGQMLKTMRQTSLTTEADVLGESQSLKLYREMLDQQWAQKMVAGKGFGFAEMMVKAMEARNKAVTPELAAQLAEPGGKADPIPLRPDASAPSPAGVKLFRDETGPDAALPAPVPLPERRGFKPEPVSDPRQAFLDRLRPQAEAVAADTGIPAAFILAHAALESGWGRSEIRNADGSGSHNLFGIKAGRGWPGDVAEQSTLEYRHGVPIRVVEPFRAYASYEEAFRDYADLLGKRYREAATAGSDAGAFARGLAEGGYATDPDYAGKLRRVIASVAALDA